jgi:hypothetical protein
MNLLSSCAPAKEGSAHLQVQGFPLKAGFKVAFFFDFAEMKKFGVYPQSNHSAVLCMD